MNWQPVDAAQIKSNDLDVDPSRVNIFYDPAGTKDENNNTIADGNPSFHPYRFLHDFSYAGYHQGKDPIPPLKTPSCLERGLPVVHVSDYCTPNSSPQSGGSDCRTGIQNAINEAQNTNKYPSGAIVYFGPGEYVVTTIDKSPSLTVNKNNITLCGAGPDKTFIKVDPRRSRGSVCREANTADLAYRTFCASENTVLKVEPPNESGNGWTSFLDSNAQSALSKNEPFPTKTISVDNGGSFNPGDEIIITGDRTAAYLREHDMDHPTEGWPSGQAYLFRRTITGKDGNKLALDVPTRYRLKTTDNARVWKVQAGHTGIREFGLESLSIGEVRHPIDWDTSECPGDKDPRDCRDVRNDDNSFKFPAIREMYVHEVLELYNTADSYVYDVRTYKPAENATRANAVRIGNYDVHFLNMFLFIKQSRHVTVDTLALYGAQVDKGNHNGYATELDRTNEILFNNITPTKVKKGLAFNGGGTSGNVIKNIKFIDIIDYQSDFHSYLGMANLIENSEFSGCFFEAAVRPLGGTRHGHGTTETVFWNNRGTIHPTDGINDSADLKKWIDVDWWWERDNDHDRIEDDAENPPQTSVPVNSDFGVVVSNQYGWGYVIGTNGPFNKIITARIPDRRYPGQSMHPTILPQDFCEGNGCPIPADPSFDYSGPLEPASLYDAQLALRLGPSSAQDPAGTIITDNRDATFNATGTWTLSGAQNPYKADSLNSFTAGDTATWTGAVPAARAYDVYFWWTEHTNRATNVTYRIYDGDTLLGTKTINQTSGGGNWNHQGAYTFSSQARVVMTAGTSAKSSNADAIKLVPQAPVDLVIDNADPGFTTSGSWSVSAAEGSYGNDSVNSFNSGDTATWATSAQAPGSYDVYLRWTQHANRATNVTYRIYDGNTPLDTKIINQTSGGGQWNLQGTYTFSSGTKRIEMTAGTSTKSSNADAVRFVHRSGGADTTPPTAPVVLDEGEQTALNNQLTASWLASSDPESGIAGYSYRITRDTKTGTVVQDWTSAGTATTATATGLSLMNGAVYYFTVEARNGSGLSRQGYSDGILVAAPTFIRGDINDDGVVNLSDFMVLLNDISGKEPYIPCLDAADLTDNGLVNLEDAMLLLRFLFNGEGVTWPVPFPDPGVDTTPDNLRCDL